MYSTNIREIERHRAFGHNGVNEGRSSESKGEFEFVLPSAILLQ